MNAAICVLAGVALAAALPAPALLRPSQPLLRPLPTSYSYDPPAAPALPAPAQPVQPTPSAHGPSLVQLSPQTSISDSTSDQQVFRNIFLYSPPPPAPVPLPPRKTHYNFVFVRTGSAGGLAGRVVAPAPQQKTLVYLLSRRPTPQELVIQAPAAPPTKPEVYFVNYQEGDDAPLPGGVSLATALSHSTDLSSASASSASASSAFASSTSTSSSVSTFSASGSPAPASSTLDIFAPSPTILSAPSSTPSVSGPAPAHTLLSAPFSVGSASAGGATVEAGSLGARTHL